MMQESRNLSASTGAIRAESRSACSVGNASFNVPGDGLCIVGVGRDI